MPFRLPLQPPITSMDSMVWSGASSILVMREQVPWLGYAKVMGYVLSFLLNMLRGPQARLSVALSVTVRLRVLCHLPLRLADFCGAPQRALAKTGALRRSQLPVSAAGSGRCSRPHGGRQVHARGWRSGGGKANLLTASPYTPFAGFDGGTLGSPVYGGAGETPAGRRD